MKVAIVAGEKSGDFLGAELIKAIRQHHPDSEFVGLCGPLMQAQGAQTLAEMDTISIFGLEGLFSSLREILAIRKALFKHFIAWQPDVFIGIDVPDFNLALERKLKDSGIPTVHYVSPTVWAWRGGRIKKIRRAINLMLTLFPFEKDYYRQHDTPVEYVGHPLARQVSQWQVDDGFKQSVSYGANKTIAVLPGSRMSEVSRLAPQMIEGAMLLAKKYTGLQFVLPAASPKIRHYIETECDFDSSVLQIVDEHSRDVLSLCDLVILASGTAALEAALFAKPMVVMYRVAWLSAFVFKGSIQVEHFSMPNHLTSPPAVPELIQEQATSDNLVREVARLLDDQAYFDQMQQALSAIAPKLSADSGAIACAAIEGLLERNA